MADVVISQLSKTFPGGTVALDNVSLTVADGEFVVLVGPSGCGKSTLLRVIAGLEDATTGTVAIGGQVVNDLSPKDRDIAMVFQNYALYPHMTVEQNLGFSLRLRKMHKPQVRAQVDEVARVLALEPLLGRKPAALSGGQRQRVAMGRAMVRHPKVFLMDEPLSNLDAKLRVAMRGELTRLHRQYHTTTLYVTHDQVEAMTLGDRIAVLNNGQLQQVGTPDELYTAPCNVFVAGFIGSPAMNMARGRVTGTPDEPVLEIGGQHWPLPVLHTVIGRDVIIGLRPHALTLASTRDAGPHIRIRPVAVESLGDEKNILFLPPFEVPDVTGEAAAAAVRGGPEAELVAMWTASLDADTRLAAGDEVTLAVDLDAAYFFDAATGLAVPAVAAQAAMSAG